MKTFKVSILFNNINQDYVNIKNVVVLVDNEGTTTMSFFVRDIMYD